MSTISLDDNQHFIVKIGDVQCTVTASTSTQITCVPGKAIYQLGSFVSFIKNLKTVSGLNPAGTYAFTVNVLGKGLARISSATTTLDFPLVTSSITPTSSGTGGKYRHYFSLI